MAMIRHPLTLAEYRRRADGLVDVALKNGTVGVFDRQGQWISGRVRIADPALCYWVAVAPETAPSVMLSGLEKST
jgi:hypothetical protein